MRIRFPLSVAVVGVLSAFSGFFASRPAAAAPTAADAETFVAKAEADLAADSDFQSAVGHAAALSLTPCNITGLAEPARCGALDVPENPQRPNGRHLSISVVVIPATATPVRPDPIVFLMGGPGEDVIGDAADLSEQFADLRKDHDLLLVDQRGTGRSGALHCDLYSPENPAASLRDLFPVDAVKRCEQQLSVHADLTQYTYTHFANDLEQVRLALGYGPLNLSGGSYGTRAAQVFMRAFPNSVRTAFVGSVVPVDVANPGPFASTQQVALEKTLDACLSDSDCKAVFPNLRAEFHEMVVRLDSGQARVTLPGGTVTAVLDRGRVAEWFRSKLYRPRSSADLPWLIHRASLGDWDPIAAGILENAREVDRALSLGLLFSITCSDDVPFVREEDVSKATFLRDYRLRQQQAACRVWPKVAVPEGYRTPVTSKVPTMFVSGDEDGGTPLWYMEHASKGFSRRVTLIERGQGHTEWNECVGKVYEQFVRSGSVQGLQTSQCDPVPRPPFKIR
jgi:pimeloyl-ACP methyl ester carboxylesterase